ncbi:hypothetical protein [Nesterenkonia sp. Act20]|uniref:hypothetical protein n=1 Tax=Nesterenkonia sp. Act20 TaxID=1483432 RepID=UPI001C4613AD|nr:hypothetical protein [Nesterenkonia sp. Act20]
MNTVGYPEMGVRRYVGALIVAPLLAVGLAALTYVLQAGSMPDQIAVHMGPDGTGFGSLTVMVSVCFGLALLGFVIGAVTARNTLRRGEWHLYEKSIVVVAEAAGFAFTAAVLGVILSIDVPSGEVPGAAAVEYSLLAWVASFAVALLVYALLTPRARPVPV